MEQAGWGSEMVQAARDGRVTKRQLLQAAIECHEQQLLEDVLIVTDFLMSGSGLSHRRRYIVRSLRAESYADAELFDEAILEYAAALEEAGKAAGAGKRTSAWGLDVTLANLGHALLEAGETVRGLKAYMRAFELNPENEPAQLILGCNLVEQGMPRMAIPFLIRAIRLSPDRVETWSLLAEALRREGKRCWAERLERRAAERRILSSGPEQ